MIRIIIFACWYFRSQLCMSPRREFSFLNIVYSKPRASWKKEKSSKKEILKRFFLKKPFCLMVQDWFGRWCSIYFKTQGLDRRDYNSICLLKINPPRSMAWYYMLFKWFVNYCLGLPDYKISETKKKVG